VSADGFLPPVVIEIAVNDTAAIAKLAEFKAAMANTTTSLGASSAGISSGLSKAEGEAATAAGGIHARTGQMAMDLEGIGVGAATGGATTERAMKDASTAVTKGEEEIASKSASFSSRTGSAFSKLGTTMGNLGLPFGKGVTKMGEDFKNAESKGAGFTSMMAGIGKVALLAGAAIGVGFGVYAVKAFDAFDVANKSLNNAITNTHGSVSQLEPSITKTEKSFVGLGFTTTQTAEALGILTTSTGSETKAQGELGLAADLSRKKHISLAAAAQTLSKINAGSLRALTQLGLQYDIGSMKLTAAIKAEEGVTKAKTALKVAEENLVVAQKKGAEEHAAAVAKVKTADEALKQAQESLKSDSEGLASAQESLTTAQEGVTEAAQKQKLAVKEAAAAVKSAEEAAKEAAETGAKGIEEAKKNLSALEKERVKEGNESSIKAIENEEKTLEATKSSANEAALVTLRAKKATLEATDKGIEAQKKEAQLQQAHKGIIDAEATAHKNNKTAIDAVSKAHSVLAEKQRDEQKTSKENVAAAHAVDQAQRGVSTAVQKLSRDQDTVRKDTEALSLAQTAAAKPPAAVAAAEEKLKAAHEALSTAEAKLQKDHIATSEVLSKLGAVLKNEAIAYTKTFAGQLEIAKARINDLAVAVGAHLVPILTSLLKTMTSVVEWFGKGSLAAKALAIVIGGVLTLAIGTYVAKLLSSLAPMAKFAVKLGEMGLTGGKKLVEGLASGFSGIGNTQRKALSELETAKPKWSAAGKALGLLSGAAIGIALLFALNEYKGKIDAFLAKEIGGPFAKGAYKIDVSSINENLKHQIENYQKTKVPKAAEGGIVSKPTLVEVGEDGPEAIVPLRNLSMDPASVAPLPLNTPATALGGTGGSSGGGLHVGAINLYGAGASAPSIVQELYLKMRPMLLSTG
jgi:hypothetical protein